MTAVHSPGPSSPPAGTAVSGFVDRGWEFRGYHSWNAYCGQAAAPGLAGPAPAVVPTQTAAAQPARTSAVNGRPRLPQPATLASYQEDLHRVHDLADHLNRLRFDGAIHAHRHTLPADLAYKLADAIEILTEIRDSLPTGTPHPIS